MKRLTVSPGSSVESPGDTLTRISRGLGASQRAILDTLTDSEHGNLTVAALGERIGVPIAQARRAARALERRGLVVITKGSSGWKGVGDYGPLMQRRSLCNGYGDAISTAKVIKQGEPCPWSPKWYRWYRASREVELVRAGMPTPALFVWLPEKRAAHLEADIKQTAGLGRALGLREAGRQRLAGLVAEYERLTSGRSASSRSTNWSTGGCRTAAGPARTQQSTRSGGR